MIGNDIVDLALAKTESNWQRRGFLEKLFTASERQMILESENPELRVWDLWSRKEAGYKIYNRMTKKRSYNPQQLQCTDIGQKDGICYGKVGVDSMVFYTKTFVKTDYVYTEAVTDTANFKKITTLISMKNVCKDNDGRPYYIDSSSIIRRDVSITHHGIFHKCIVLKI